MNGFKMKKFKYENLRNLGENIEGCVCVVGNKCSLSYLQDSSGWISEPNFNQLMVSIAITQAYIIIKYGDWLLVQLVDHESSYYITYMK